MALRLTQKIASCLWFNGQAEQAARFYTSIFPRSKIVDVLRWGNVGPGPKGSVLHVTFELAGMEVQALNGGPTYQLTPAFSFSVICDTQAELDRYWKKLLTGGKAMACGWLTDKFGVSWQIVPRVLPKLLRDKNPARADRAMKAMMGMVKFDIAELESAVKGGAKSEKPASRARRATAKKR